MKLVDIFLVTLISVVKVARSEKFPKHRNFLPRTKEEATGEIKLSNVAYKARKHDIIEVDKRGITMPLHELGRISVQVDTGGRTLHFDRGSKFSTIRHASSMDKKANLDVNSFHSEAGGTMSIIETTHADGKKCLTGEIMDYERDKLCSIACDKDEREVMECRSIRKNWSRLPPNRPTVAPYTWSPTDTDWPTWSPRTWSPTATFSPTDKYTFSPTLSPTATFSPTDTKYPQHTYSPTATFSPYTYSPTDTWYPLRAPYTRSPTATGYPTRRCHGYWGPCGKKRLGRLAEKRAHVDDGSVIDVMFVWTKLAECRNAKLQEGCVLTDKTKDAMMDICELAIAQTNQAFKNSAIHTQLRLVHAYRHPTYVENCNRECKSKWTGDITDWVLKSMKTPNNGIMDDVHKKREKYKADMVSLMIDNRGLKFDSAAENGHVKEGMFNVITWNTAAKPDALTFAHSVFHTNFKTPKPKKKI